MLKIWQVIYIFCALLVSTGDAKSATKLIHYGWDNPKISSLPMMLDKFAKSPFDGISIKADHTTEIFTASRISESAIADDLNVLKQINPGVLADSYLVVHAATDGVFDWANDKHWISTLENMRLQVRLAKAGGFKGIAFDMEPYGKSPWDYRSQQAENHLSFAEFESLVEQRGVSMMNMMQDEFPGIDLWCLYGLSALTGLLEEPQSDTNASAILTDESYGLWAPFFGGWVKAAAAKTRIIDGNEPSYYYTNRVEFDAAHRIITQDLSRFLRPGLRKAYQQKIQVGHAIFVDAIMNLHKSPRFIGYYLENDMARLELLQQNTHDALASSDTLVWIYAENTKWWEDNPRADIESALRLGKSQASHTTQQALQSATSQWKSRVSLGGKITDAAGNPVVPTGFKPALASVACSTWGDRGAYGCEFPQGTDQTVEPIVEGRRVLPDRMTFKNLKESDWGIDWKVE
jgi:hypothetical protein